MSERRYTVAAGVHVYVEIEFGMSENHTLREVTDQAERYAESILRDALTVATGPENSMLLTHRTKTPRIDHVIVNHAEEGES